ncbi:MAG: glycine cleavage system protein T, partial [Desulfovibrio sp.]|nr:glycine cleavage system protein T [Desulfovibrio sp.]
LGARDTLRMEAGLPLYGDELDEKHTPVEAGMGRMMKNECDYVGKKGLEQVREVLLGLELEGRRAARHGDRLCLESGEEVGVVTSGTFAPSLGKSIAFAWCRAGREGADSFVIDNGRAKLKARKVETPFYKDGTARVKLQ